MKTPCRVPVAFINNSVTPYRIHLHSRLVEELPEIKLWSVFTHEVSTSPWKLTAPREIRPMFFGPGEHSLGSDAASAQPHEWRKAGFIIQWLRREHVEAVILGGYNDIGRLRLLWWCWRRRIPCFLWGDSNIHWDVQTAWKRTLKRVLLPQVLRLCTGVLCCGSYGEDYFCRYGVPKQRIFRFPCEPDYSQFQNVHPQMIHGARQEYGLKDDRRFLIYSGRLASIKRVDLLLRAFARIAGARPEWDLIIAGDGEERLSLETLIPPEVANRVIWTGFIREPEKLAALYAAAHLLVLPSDYENWGVVVTEAATRMPVIASSVVGAAADLIADGVNGRIFPRGDLDSLTGCLLDLTTPPILAAMTAASPLCFTRWRQTSDPITGFRAALHSVSLLHK